MKKDIDQKLKNILNSLDKNQINSGKQSIEQLLKTPEGKKLAGSLNGIDKNKLLEKFMNMDSSEIKNKLQNADLSKLSKLNAEDILKKLR